MATSAHSEVESGLQPLFPRLWRYCLVLTGKRDGADDLAQAVCLRALEKSHLYQAGTQLDRWIFRMAHNTWINEIRKNSVRTGAGVFAIEDIELPDENPNPETNLMTRQVLSLVMELPETQRETVLLVYVEGYSYREAAETLDIPIGTVMSRLSAARGKLTAQALQESGTP